MSATRALWNRVAATALGTSLALSLVSVPLILQTGTVAVLGPANLLRIWNACRAARLEPQADRIREQIRASWGEGAPAWSGSYSHSNGFEGFELDLGPAGFYFEARACIGTQELAFGKIANVDGERIRLEIDEHVIVEQADDRDGRPRFRLSEELFSVPWGNKRFLVPAELMPQFCSFPHAGGYAERFEPGESALDWNRAPLVGLPDVPAEFRAYLPR